MVQLSQEELERRILNEADGLVVVDKPFDLPSTGQQLDDPDSLQHALIERYGTMTWAVHQLDADTSGVNLFVRERQLVKVWQGRLRYPTARKEYFGILHGSVAGAELLVDTDIEGRHAVTRICPLERCADATLARIWLETGRTHQIRIHLERIGHPLLGERWYRRPQCTRHPRQALHAHRVHLPDATLVAPIPADLRSLAGELGLSLASGH